MLFPGARPANKLPRAALNSKPLAWDQHEQHAERRVDEDCHGEHHERPPSEQLPDVGFAHAGEVERGVFAQTDEGEDGIERVLIGGKAVDPNREGKNKL